MIYRLFSNKLGSAFKIADKLKLKKSKDYTEETPFNHVMSADIA